MSSEDLILRSLGQPKDAVHATTTKLLAEQFPDRQFISTENSYFVPSDSEGDWTFARADQPGLWSVWLADWETPENVSSIYPAVGWYECAWQDQKYLLLAIAIEQMHCISTRWHIIAEPGIDPLPFFEAVCKHNSTLSNEVLVFQEGRFFDDDDLLEAVQKSSLDDLVLHGDLKSQIVEDIELFLSQQSTFEKYRIPWKRGMLFLGPPGNGKTHMIRALVNHLARPCLYIKSFESRYLSSQQCVAQAFERAREITPCVMILEDLDTLLTDETRSFFLNEMDGFASNHGIITIATCNFPEKLDPAILDRPSRFDRKYHFDLPNEEVRMNFLKEFSQRFDESLQLDEDGLKLVGQQTEGFSFAYLKELYVAAAIRWFSTDQHRAIVDVICEQTETLLAQMKTEWDEVPPASSNPQPDMAQMMRRMRRKGH
jgi:AAA+ superfamily predicted ATPase